MRHANYPTPYQSNVALIAAAQPYRRNTRRLTHHNSGCREVRTYPLAYVAVHTTMVAPTVSACGICGGGCV